MKSKHLVGLAVDFQLMNEGKPVYKSPLYELLGEFWTDLGGTWGGHWNFYDPFHFEYKS